MAKEVKKVAFLTAGGLAPCLSSSIGFLIDEYNKVAPNVEMIGYVNGYMGLLKGESIPVTDGVVSAENLEQAIERCGTKQGNKGFAAMQAAIELANVLKQI